MATAKSLFDSGDLRGAIEALTAEVKANPTDSQRRTFLFELLCFAGEWDRAERQLNVLGTDNANADIGAQIFRNCIKAERDRARLYSDGLAPHFLGEPPPYVDMHLSAINRVREGNLAEARELLDRAEEERPAFAGTFNGAPFSDFRDYNDFTGPVLEVIVHDKYTWIPIHQIKEVEIQAPKQLRDLIWSTLRIESLTGPIGEALLCMLYAGSGQHSDDAARLGRMTDWKELAEGFYQGFGMRSFLVDEDERGAVEMRTVTFAHGAVEDTQEGEADDEPAADGGDEDAQAAP